MPFRNNPTVLSSLLSLLLFCAPVQAETSKLWGTSGELWSPSGRLPDFSYAGYQSGNKSIPNVEVVANVKEFGAKGDGRTDDSEAFIEALESAKKGAILVPKGKYVITQVLRFSRRGIVLRGEGMDQTILYFPKPLEDVVGPGKEFAPSGSWSWDGGFLLLEGSENRGVSITDITANAPRGAKILKVSDTERVHKGQRIRILMTNTDGSLGRHLHADKTRATSMVMGKTLVDFSCVVESVGKNQITIDRPIRFEVKTHWKPRLETDMPVLEDAGVENLTIAFPPKPYAPHHDEPGFNGIAIRSASNCWVRNVKIINSDCGVVFRARSKFCTVENLELSADPKRKARGWEGHHGVEIADMSQDNLIKNFKIGPRFIHAFSVTSMASGNVMSNGEGSDIKFDHHRKLPYANLYTQINAGKGTNIWYSGGDEEAGPPSGAWETFWNISVETPHELPEWSVFINVIGLTTRRSSNTNGQGDWFEAIPPAELTPPNLYESQLQRRLKFSKQP